MIEGRDIICFSNDWDSDPLSKKHIMLRLARKNRVLWINSISNRQPTLSGRDLRRAWKKMRDYFKGTKSDARNIIVYSPLVIPFHHNPLARWFNRNCLRYSLKRLCRRLGFVDPITWTFEPSSAEVAGRLGEKLLVYHCVDEFSEFDGVNRSALLAMERRLLQKADLVLVSSTRLYETKRQYNPNVFLVTHGVDIEHFRQACTSSVPIPPEVSALPHPVIGFFGLIAPWVDLELIRYLAASRPAWSFVLLGKLAASVDTLKGLPNIHLLGRKEYAQLPAYCKAFDAAILTFVVNHLTLAANPLKLREYLAAGLPVVSTALPEAEMFAGPVRIGKDPAEFLHHLDALISEGKTGPQLEISRAMEIESWDHKVEMLSRLVEQASRAEHAKHGSRKQPQGGIPEIASGDSLYVQ